jgi:hypothetical protein
MPLKRLYEEQHMHVVEHGMPQELGGDCEHAILNITF